MFSFSSLNSSIHQPIHSVQFGETTLPLSQQTSPSSLLPTGRASVCVHSSVSVHRCGGDEDQHRPKTGKEEGEEVERDRQSRIERGGGF